MLDMLVEFLRSALSGLVSLLPQDPFVDVFSGFGALSQGLGWLNWFVPVGALLGIMSVWLVAIAGYYVYKALLHWIGVSS